MKKYLFIDRDGTLVIEPPVDFQVDRLDKIKLLPDVIPALLRLSAAGYHFIMVSNQDGLGTESFPEADFTQCQDFIIELFASQGIHFEQLLICPHFEHDHCQCRKPNVGLVLEYLQRTDWDRTHSYVIGDRETDIQLAENMGISGLLVGEDGISWNQLSTQLLEQQRKAKVSRRSKETQITTEVNLDSPSPCKIDTGIGFFDHMLEQISRHAGISLIISCQGDLHIDDHHTVEDVAITLGQALRQALGDKRGIGRYGFYLPMDEANAQVALDISGRALTRFNADFPTEMIGEMHSEMIPHFFRSLADGLGANLHIDAKGDNSHHIAEGIFKAVARSLKQAANKEGNTLPSTKGML